MDNLSSNDLDELLQAVGEHLQSKGSSASIVVVGGTALLVLGWVQRVTKDVDVIATMIERDGRQILAVPDPLPPGLIDAVQRVARDYGLPSNWLNTEIASQWKFGLPSGFADEIQWRRYGTLDVGFAGRRSIIALKLFAAVDQGPKSVHSQDLITLNPTIEELEGAATWVTLQDAGAEFPTLVRQTVEYVRDATS